MTREEREIEIHKFLTRLDGKLDSLKEANEKELKRILDQTTKTNGRVTSLETIVENILEWRNKIVGSYTAVTVFSAIGGVGFTLLFQYLFH